MRNVAALILILFAAACGSDAQDKPTRPPINRPLDAAAYAGKVCDLLPQEQATRLGYSDGGRQDETPASADTGATGYFTCSRFPSESSPLLLVDLYLAEDRLAREYERSKSVKAQWLESLTIAGQPAAALALGGTSPRRSCEVVVGLTDTQSVRVFAWEHFSGGGGYDNGTGDGRACEYAIAIAEVIVHTLGG